MKNFLIYCGLFLSFNANSQYSTSQIIDPSTAIGADTYISKIAHADVNNDGFEDIVFSSDTTIRTFINDGFGNFNHLSTVNSTGSGLVLEFYDVDNDGDLDLFMGGQVLSNLTNDGTGVFSNLLILDNYITQNIKFGDIDNNGFMDLVSMSSQGNNSFTRVMYNIGQTNSTIHLIQSPLPVASLQFSDTKSTLELFDANNDGTIDVIYGGEGMNTFFTNINMGTNFFSTPTQNANAFTNSSQHTAIAKDVTQNGIQDLIVVSSGYPSLTNVIQVSLVKNIDWANNTNNSSQENIIYSMMGEDVPNGNYLKLDYHDLDNNGLGDIIIQSNDSIIIIMQSAVEVFDAPIKYETLGTAEDFMLMDIDNDGDLDIVYSNESNILKMENVFLGSNRLEGTIYYDANQNGIKEAGEYGLANWNLSSIPNSQTHITNSNGEYNFAFPINQTNTISAVLNPSWNLTSTNANYTETLTLTDPIIDSLDFGYFPTNSITTINPTLVAQQQLCDLNSSIWLSINNIGTTNPNGIVSLTLDNQLTYVSSNPMVDSVVNNVVYWTYSTLNFFEQTSFEVIVTQPNFNSIGDTLNYQMNVFADNNVYQNTEDYSTILLCAYDPNDKNVFPKGTGTDGFIDANQTLEYTVRFQNTGNAPATNVIVTDQLDSNLDWNSLEIVAYSHDVLTDVKPSGKVEFKFLNIMLVDSSVSYSASQGYVVYKINPIPGLIPGDVIENTADIFFDFNPEVVTNTVHNSVECPTPSITMNNGVMDCGIASNIQWYGDGLEITGETNQTYTPTQNGVYLVIYDNGNGCVSESTFDLQNLSRSNNNAGINVVAYPNPFNDFVTLKFENSLGENNQLMLIDISGRVVYTENVSNQKQIVIQKNNLSNGIYQVVLKTSHSQTALLKVSIY